MPEPRERPRATTLPSPHGDGRGWAPAVPDVGPLIAEPVPCPTSGQLGAPLSFCPRCAGRVDRPEAFVQELWVAEESVFHIWCPACGFAGNVVPTERRVGHEAVE